MEYFDYSATAPFNKTIFNKICETSDFDDLFGNPSSVHNSGIKARDMLDYSRTIIADILDCKPSEIVFTSGGTESDNIALFGIMYCRDECYKNKNEIIISKIEHPAIMKAVDELKQRGFIVKYVDVDNNGIIKLEHLKSIITPNTRLISIMSVNNETGMIQPIEEIGKIAKENNIVFHTDAVQSVGVNNLDIKDFDMMSLSGHKFGALKGTGILFKKENVKISPLIFGGGQENNLRSGTENVFGNFIMALCLKESIIAWNENKHRIEKARNYLFDELFKVFGNDIRLNGTLKNRTCNNLNISFKNIEAQTLHLLLMNDGFDVSIGSACHSGDVKPSYVLKAMNVDNDFINGNLRISMGYDTMFSSINSLLNSIIKNVSYLYNLKGGTNGN